MSKRIVKLIIETFIIALIAVITLGISLSVILLHLPDKDEMVISKS